MSNIAPEEGPAGWPADELTIGVVGVAPFATLDFLRALYAQVPAGKDWHFPRVICDINTKLPSRGRHFDLGERDPSPFIRAAIEELASVGAGVVVVPCNTAHILYDRWGRDHRVGVPNLIEVASGAARREGMRRVLVLGSAAVMRRGIYAPVLQHQGVEAVEPGHDLMGRVSAWIDEVKRTGTLTEAPKEEARRIVQSVGERMGADGVILACTELGCLAEAKLALRCVDSNAELACEALKLARVRGSA